MNGLTLSPINDPDEIRKEAASQPSNGGAGTTQSETQPANTSQAEPQSFVTQLPNTAEPLVEASADNMEVSRPSVVASSGTEPSATPGPAPVSSFEQPPSQQQSTESIEQQVTANTPTVVTPPPDRASTVSSVYPTLDSVKSGSASSLTEKSLENIDKPYAYAVPAGVYMIVAWAIAYALLMLFPIIMMMSVGTLMNNGLRYIVENIGIALAFGVISYGLIKAYVLAYWAAIIGSGLMIIQSVYNIISLGISPFGMGISWLLFIAPVVLIAVIVYLTRPNVARAFT